jgi:steroid delta-isomerase-like uncharacterized protein
MFGVAPATVVGRYIDECWNRGRIDLVDELVDADFIDHLPIEAELPNGIDGLKSMIENVRLGFSDFHIDVEDMIAEDDRVVTRFLATGTHDGPFFGNLPSNRRAQIDGIAIFRVDHHQIIDQWCMVDRDRLLQQLGIGEEMLALQQ